MAFYGKAILTELASGIKLTRQIRGALDVPPVCLGRCLRSLAKRGFITSQEGIHELTQAGRDFLATGKEVSGPCTVGTRKKSTLRAKAWQAMRLRDFFSLDDLLMMLSDGTEKTAEDNLCSYLYALTQAGYLFCTVKGHERRFRLRRERYTGPEAPAWNKLTRTLTDMNSGEIFYLKSRKKHVLA